jgi:four helix bundle protein
MKFLDKITEKFPKSSVRLTSQARNAARSAKQNIREGYSKDTAGKFARAIKISRSSLSELEGDINDCKEDDLIPEDEYKTVKGLIRFTLYRIDKYLDALYKLELTGKRKNRFRRRPK